MILELVHLELPNTRISTGQSVAIEALIDTGADVSCMSQGVAEALGIKPQADALSIRITGAAGGITPAVTLPGLTVHIRRYTLQVDFLMLPLGTTNMILGLDIISAPGATITCNPSGVEFNPKCDPERNNKLGAAREEAFDPH